MVLKYPKNTLEGPVPLDDPSGKKYTLNKDKTIFSCILNFNINSFRDNKGQAFLRISLAQGSNFMASAERDYNGGLGAELRGAKPSEAECHFVFDKL